MNLSKIAPCLLAAASFSAVAHAETPMSALREQGCDVSLKQLASEYLAENSVLVSIYEDQTKASIFDDTPRHLDFDSFELCGSTDLDPGSWNVRRVVSFCNGKSDRVEIFTVGQLWCNDEKVLGIKSISLKP